MYQSYIDYLNSPEWKKKRWARLEIDNYRCRLCGIYPRSSSELHVHHIPSSYKLIPNESIENDLLTLCIECHEMVTQKIKEYRVREQKEQEILNENKRINDERMKRISMLEAIPRISRKDFNNLPDEYVKYITHTSVDIQFAVNNEPIITYGLMTEIGGWYGDQRITVIDKYGSMLIQAYQAEIGDYTIGRIFIFVGTMLRSNRKNAIPRIKLSKFWNYNPDCEDQGNLNLQEIATIRGMVANKTSAHTEVSI